MKRELLRIVEKKNWTSEEVDELRVIFESELSECLEDVEPDILETALRHLVKGRGSDLKRLNTASKMTGIPSEYLIEVLHILHPSRYPFPDSSFIERVKKHGLRSAIEIVKRGERTVQEREPDFPDIVERLERLHPLDLEISLLKDAETAWEISKSFRDHIVISRVHPYIIRVIGSKKRIPLVVDGSNLIWKANLDPRIIEDLFVALADHRTTFYPVFLVFDANVEHVVPGSRKNYIKKVMNKETVYVYSPADELILALARQKKAWVMSSDKFRDHDTRGIKIVDFPDI